MIGLFRKCQSKRTIVRLRIHSHQHAAYQEDIGSSSGIFSAADGHYSSIV
jgi:hypothetical protein